VAINLAASTFQIRDTYFGREHTEASFNLSTGWHVQLNRIIKPSRRREDETRRITTVFSERGNSQYIETRQVLIAAPSGLPG
jgi:hypothetical protein